MQRHFFLTIILILVIIFTQCKPKPVWLDSVTEFSSLKEQANYKRPCSENINNAPDAYTSRKIIKTNVHFIDSPEQDATWPLEEGKAYMQVLIGNANERLSKNVKMNLPIGNNTPVLDPAFRYQVVGVEPGDDGYYYHIDSSLYYYIAKGKYRNHYRKDVIEKYAIAPDSILNIFVISHPQDSLQSKSYKAVGQGIALGTSLKMTGLYSNRNSPAWSFGNLLNHEIGHVLGLGHAWTKYDGCDDTPAHPNCWDANASTGRNGKPCGKSYSNNVMDYNNVQMAYTPCQLGRIHKGLNLIGSGTRGLIYDSWCDYDPDEVIIISDKVEWKGDRDINSDIIISAGGRLDLHCRLSMAQGSRITIAKGGQLHLHSHSKIHNACGHGWNGIQLMDEKEKNKMLFVYGNGRMEDVIDSQDYTRKSKLVP